MTETSGPRGRISLIKSVAEGRLDILSPGFTAQMSECLDCRACEAACPSGVQYGSLLEHARAEIEAAQAPARPLLTRFARALALHALFANPGIMRGAARVLRFAQRTGLIKVAALLGLSREAALAPEIPDAFFIADNQRYDVANAAGLAFLHTGCVMHVAFGRVHESTIRMLNRAGLSVSVPRAQGCCGAIAVHAGDPSFARALATTNIVAFERSGADVYVVNAAGCGASLKEYGELFSGDADWAERAAKFSARVRDVLEVLDAMELPPMPRRIDAVVTYQEPCHLVHAQRVSAAPRRLLEKIPGLVLREMNESALCCGSAGLYNLTQRAMSERLAARKIANVEETGASIVATANPGCAMQLRVGLDASLCDARIAHVVELLDEAYN